MKKVHSNFFLLESALTERIVRGVYPPGGSLPSAAELSAEFSVSTATVKRVLDALAQGGVIRRRQGRSPVVTPVALRPPRQERRIVIVRDVVKSIFFEYRSAPWNWTVQQLLYHRLLADHAAIFTICKTDIAAQASLLRTCSGAFYTTPIYNDDSVAEDLARLGLPCEIVSAYSATQEPADMVCTGFDAAAEEIATYFLAHGIRAVDVVSMPGESDLRLHSFFTFLEERGFPPEKVSRMELASEAMGEHYREKAKPAAPLGIVCYTGFEAAKIHDILTARGWRPKKDFVLAALSVLEEMDWISGCDLEFEALTRLAVERLYRRCAGEPPEPFLRLDLRFRVADT